MGKKRHLMIVLILGAAGLWGYIMYVVWDSFFKQEIVQITQTVNTQEKNLSSEPDTFTLLANYRDPFLSEQVRKPELVQKRVAQVVPSPPKVIQPWPEVSYGGMIRNQQTNSQLALITVNGKSELVGPGVAYQDLLIRKIYKDSVELAFGKEIKMVKK